MILHRLVALYDRLLSMGEIEAPGFQPKEILWVVTLTEDGRFAGLIATGDGKKRGAKYVVPAEIKKSVNIAANLLWENPEYVFGVVRANAEPKQAAKVPARHAAFLARLRDLPDDVQSDAGLRAVRTFLEAGDFSAIEAEPRWADLAVGGANVSFRLDGDTCLVCERSALRTAIAALAEERPEAGALLPWCLVSGRRSPPARLHPNIKGIVGGQSSGNSLVAFNLDAFTSHGWEKGDNAPVGQRAAMAYGAALNWLLTRRDRPVTQHREGETTFVFWAEESHEVIERLFPETLGEHVTADPDSDGTEMKRTLASVRMGFEPLVDDSTGYYVLALAPNAARLSVRSWHQTTVGAMAQRFQNHFDALAIVGLDDQPFPTLWRLLAAAAPQGDLKRFSDSLRSRLADEMVSAILDGTPYPATLLARIVERCRVEAGQKPDDKNPRQRSWTQLLTLRTALIKAVLCRRQGTSDEWRTKAVNLDRNNTDPGYLLGRLFAVLEYAQYKAHSSDKNDKAEETENGQGKKERSQPINATIRDRYFGAAMTAPRAVFVQLERLKTAHFKKLRRDKPGLWVTLDKEIESIWLMMTPTGKVPSALDLEQQSQFIMGYYHQRHERPKKMDEGKDDVATLPEHSDD